MKASAFPVFWKDLRSLLKPLAAFLVLQVVYVVGFLSVYWYWERSLPPFSAFAEVMILAALVLGQDLSAWSPPATCSPRRARRVPMCF